MKVKDLRKEKRRKADMMARKALLDSITMCSDEYQKAYPKTADSDLKLVAAYCTGISAAHVALDHNCAESTVHRALNRVRAFLRLQDYADRWKPLINHIMEHSPNWGDCEPEGVLDMIYETYREFNVMDDTQTKSGFRELYRLLDGLTIQEQDPVIYAVCDLCHQHQRTGFTEGIKLGIRLGEELRA